MGQTRDSLDALFDDRDPLPALGPPARAGELGTFGGYRVLELVGSGGMGAVYRAVDPALGRTVALKVMLPRLAATEVARQRFLREARAVAAIRHDNVVTVYQVGEAGHPFYAMEFLTGRSLEARLAEPLPVTDAVRVARELAEGLAAAHAAGVVHRDVKPGNVWLLDQPSGPFRTKLLDFGLARVLDGDAPLTRTGTLLGTVAYMAPEQARGAGVPRSDVFGLGAVLYQMLAGRPAFDHATALRLLSEPDAWQPPPALDAVAPHLPAQLCATVAVMLDPDPERRPTAEAVATVLRAVEAQLLFGGVRPTARSAENVSHEAVTLAEGSRPTLTQAVPRPAAAALAGARGARRTYRFAGAAVAVALACAAAAVLHLMPKAPVQQPEGPRPAPIARAPAPHPKRLDLFNGRDRAGWHAPKGTATDGWSVADGALVGTPKPNGMQWLLTDDEYGDFDLRVEYRWLEPGGHTFVAFRALDAPADPNRVVGLFVNLRDEDTLPGGEPEYPLYRTGGILTVQTPAERFARPAGEWNELRVVARGQRVRIEHNGALALEANLDEHAAKAVKLPALRWAKGHIGLCSHRWAPIAYGRVSISPPP